jgi:hypothetical protein
MSFDLSVRFDEPGPSGTTAAIESIPDNEDRIIYRRIGELNATLNRTVEGIGDIAERETSDGR